MTFVDFEAALVELVGLLEVESRLLDLVEVLQRQTFEQQRLDTRHVQSERLKTTTHYTWAAS